MREAIGGVLVACAVAAGWPVQVLAQEPPCSVPLFRGATQPQGGQAEMRVVNNGQACGIRNFGRFPDDRSLAHAGSITTPAQHGVARFVAPRAVYTPTAGFVGEDHFEYEANARGPDDIPVLLRVKVKVVVLAP